MAIIKCPECNADISSQAKTCPHCGYPVKPEEKISSYRYFLCFTANDRTSALSVLLAIVAFLIVICGIIVSYKEAEVVEEVASWYTTRKKTNFSVGVFLSSFLPYFVYFLLLLGVSSAVSNSNRAASMLEGLDLTKEEETAPASRNRGGLSTPWRCSCGQLNEANATFCKKCYGEKK